MHELLRDLIQNAAIMIAGLYLVDKCLKEPLSFESSLREKVRAGILSGALGVLLMFFSIKLTNHVIIDLRQIPVIVISYYAGFIPGIVASLIIAVARLFFGMNGASVMVFSQTILIGVIAGFVSKYFRKGVFLTITLINVLVMCLISVSLFTQISDKDLYKTVVFFFWFIAIPTGLFTGLFFRDIQQSKKLFINYKEEAKTDYLTGLNNVRQFDAEFSRFIKKSQEKDEAFSLLLIDIDYFKKINDTYGHDAGNSVLQQLSHLIKQNTRSFDKVFRNGGEEFSILLPESTLKQSMEIAERLRKAIESHLFLLPDENTINVTISGGLSSFPDTTKNAEESYKQADKALYMAKSFGRNQIVGFNHY